MSDGFAGAMALVSRTLEKAIRPVPPLRFRAWLPQNIILIDGPQKGEAWSIETAPYLGEIADCLDLGHPCNLVTVRKCQQSGVSILALAWSLHIAETAPDNILYAVPGIDALQDMNGKKLQPLIDAWRKRTGKEIIVPVTSRSGAGSTTYEKRFAGGSVSLANANSVMDLSAKTSRYGVKDEVSKWVNTPNGDDPEALFFGRFTAFRRQKSYKIFELSTPENDSGDELGEDPAHCRVDRSFRRSDQRYWHIACPECAADFVQTIDGFVIAAAQPHKSSYECPACGHHLSEIERVAAVQAGRFVPSYTDPDRHPGFHVDAFISLMMSYEAIAEDNLKQAARGEAGAKAFTNLDLALPYAMKGNAPDWQRLMERREDYEKARVPAEGLIFVAGADVQHDGIFIEAVAFAEDRQSWSVSAEFLPGRTDDPRGGAFALLAMALDNIFVDGFGNDRTIEALAVDAGDGGRTNQVLEWCRRHPRTYAVKGDGGRGKPAIGSPMGKSVRKSGKRQRFGGAKLWPVGTWSLKSELYGNLHKPGQSAGEPTDPPGYCHFAKWHDEEFFRQLTAEYFEQVMANGRLREEWKKVRRDNHFLDARIYAMAMAELMGLTKMRPEEWAALRSHYAPDGQEIDLLSSAARKAAASARKSEVDVSPPVVPATPPKPTRPNRWRRK